MKTNYFLAGLIVLLFLAVVFGHPPKTESEIQKRQESEISVMKETVDTQERMIEQMRGQIKDMQILCQQIQNFQKPLIDKENERAFRERHQSPNQE